tara:strand:- start:6477 stop:6617 length:141 start_codon:yes stop_codon:yes gene_type:complete
MNKKKYTQLQRILRLENIVSQMYIKLEALKIIIDKKQKNKSNEHTK